MTTPYDFKPHTQLIPKPPEPLTTLHFRAETFEATATRVDLPTPERSAERNITHYVISPRGEASKTLCLYRPEKEPLGGIVPFRGAQVSIMTPRGWKEIAMRVTAEDPELLALAISLLYSVPGVEVYEPLPARPEFPAELSGTVVTSRWLCSVANGAVLASTPRGSMTTKDIASWCRENPMGRYCYVDSGGEGKSLLEDLRKLFGLEALPLPKLATEVAKSRDVIPPDRCPECRLLLPEHRMMCSWEEVKP